MVKEAMIFLWFFFNLLFVLSYIGIFLVEKAGILEISMQNLCTFENPCFVQIHWNSKQISNKTQIQAKKYANLQDYSFCHEKYNLYGIGQWVGHL